MSMKKQEISEFTKISKSTLSKTLRHCSGVDTETRHRILTENPVREYAPGQYAVYCILPDVPNFFWKEALRGLMDYPRPNEVPVKYNVYTKLGDTETVMIYLEEAKRLDVRVLIIAAILEPPVREMLEELVKDRLVIFLSEQEELVNSFYVGSDAYRDGYALGQRYVSEYKDRKLVMLSADGGRNIQLRLDGFRDAVRTGDEALLNRAKLLHVAHDELIFKRSASANLAAALAGETDDCCLYIPCGVPQLSVAVGKLRKRGLRMRCLCHDSQGTEEIISCNQNLYAQGAAAMEAACRFVLEGSYPPQKYIFIPSEIK